MAQAAGRQLQSAALNLKSALQPHPLVRQRKDLLVSSLLDYVRVGALPRVVYYDLLDAPGTNLRDCFRPIHGTEPVRTKSEQNLAAVGCARR